MKICNSYKITKNVNTCLMTKLIIHGLNGTQTGVNCQTNVYLANKQNLHSHYVADKLFIINIVLHYD